MNSSETAQSNLELQVLRRDKQAVIVHHADERGAWATCDRKILYQPAGTSDWETIGFFPFAAPRDLFAWSRSTKRATRVDKCNLFPTRDGRLLGIRAGMVYEIENSVSSPIFSIQGDCVLHRGIAESSEGNIYFGEYFRNPKRVSVHIWRVSPDLNEYGIAYTFKSGTIRHVHGVYRDPCRQDRLWITVGDFKGECYFLIADAEFQKVQWIGDGTQMWRAVGLLFSDNSVFWLTDSHLEQNHIVSLDRETLQITIHGDVESSSWYCAQTADNVFLAATTVEEGPGVKTNKASLMASRDGINWKTLTSFKKDSLPMVPFKYGIISFPSGNFSSNYFWISGEALVGLDGCSLLCSLEQSEETEV